MRKPAAGWQRDALGGERGTAKKMDQRALGAAGRKKRFDNGEGDAAGPQRPTTVNVEGRRVTTVNRR